MKPPKAVKKEKKLIKHGHIRIDPYYWLNDHENPEVIDYLNKENEYTRHQLKDTEELQSQLFKEITGRIKPEDQSVPYRLNGYFYYTRYEKGAEHPLFLRRKDEPGAGEEVLLDADQMAKGYEYFETGSLAVSENNRYLAYSIDTVSRRKYTIHFKDLKTGETFHENIDETTGDMTWAADNQTLFYPVKNESLRPYRIYRHILGTSAKEDTLVYEETDPTFDVDVFKSKSREYIFLLSESTEADEYRFIPAEKPESDAKVIQPRQKYLEYTAEHFENHFYLLTNLQAENFRIMKTPVENPGKDHWEEVIAHRKNILIEDFDLFRDFMALEERGEGITRLRIISWDEKLDYYVTFYEKAHTVYLDFNPEFNTEKLRYKYTSLITPLQTEEIHYKTREKTVLKKQEVLGEYSTLDYETERVFATAEDGKLVPVSIVTPVECLRDGSMPMLLLGYGSYGISVDPWFSYARLSLLERGFGFAIAHVRGGQEMGRQWYKDGKLLNKKNTFSDFNDVAEFLVNKSYTSTDRLFAMGGSAGGMLTGAIANQRPDLYKGIIAAVPFVDVVTTMLDTSIPLTTGEYDEWGDPNDPIFYRYILSYSPYDNVTKQPYPAMLVTTGFHDSQVQYWEPAKWVAKLRDMKTDDNLLLFYIQMEYGHSGSAGRFERYRETAMEFAFILKTYFD